MQSGDRQKRIAPSRLSLMMAAAAGLYLGPLLAGLSQQPWWTVLVFGGFLAVWSMLYRTASWPRQFADLVKPAVLAMTVFIACVILALAGSFFLAGLGLSRIAGALPLPPAIPLLVPLVSLIAAMILQSPRKAAEFDAFLDDALNQLQGFPQASAGTEITVAAAAMAAKLVALPDNAAEADVRLAIGGPAVHDAALLAAIDKIGVPLPRPARIAAILIVTDPESAPALQDRGEGAWVFDALGEDPELLALFANRALALLEEAPHLWRDMPYSYDVDRAAAGTSNPEAALLLSGFRNRLNELSRLDGDTDDG